MTAFKVGIDIPLLPSNPGLLLSRPEQFVLYFFRNYLFVKYKNTSCVPGENILKPSKIFPLQFKKGKLHI